MQLGVVLRIPAPRPLSEDEPGWLVAEINFPVGDDPVPPVEICPAGVLFKMAGAEPRRSFRPPGVPSAVPDESPGLCLPWGSSPVAKERRRSTEVARLRRAERPSRLRSTSLPARLKSEPRSSNQPMRDTMLGQACPRRGRLCCVYAQHRFALMYDHAGNVTNYGNVI